MKKANTRFPATSGKSTWKKVLEYRQAYFLLFIPLVYLIIFSYGPIYGLQIAFKDFSPREGIWGSPWVGFDHFIRFFSFYDCRRIIVNTLILSFYNILAGIPVPLIFALAINQVKNGIFKKTVQMVSYAPHFISVVVMVGMILQFFSPIGLINNIITFFGGEAINFLGQSGYFRHLYIWTGVWQNFGFGSVLYLGVLSSVDPQLHEAAIVDGANKMQRIRYIDFPALLPTMVTMLILNVGRVMNLGFEKVLLMQNPTNTQVSEIISTYVYKLGFASAFPDYSYTTAIGMFQSVIGLVLVLIVNKVANRISDAGIF